MPLQASPMTQHTMMETHASDSPKPHGIQQYSQTVLDRIRAREAHVNIHSDDLDESRASGPSLTCECKASDDNDTLVGHALRIEYINVTDTTRFNVPSVTIVSTYSVMDTSILNLQGSMFAILAFWRRMTSFFQRCILSASRDELCTISKTSGV